MKAYKAQLGSNIIILVWYLEITTVLLIFGFCIQFYQNYDRPGDPRTLSIFLVLSFLYSLDPTASLRVFWVSQKRSYIPCPIYTFENEIARVVLEFGEMIWIQIVFPFLCNEIK